MLSERQIEDVCLVNDGPNQCRYLDDFTDNNKIIYVCRKLSPDKKTIDEQIEEFLDECLKKGIDPNTDDVALGDNCQGYICLKVKLQGYDVKVK